ncbi:MAG TPA: hypothetical protein VEX87_03740 [Skermanella sp.]|jgi:hypothetical protein|nr:hypothetical protein [Skermanella sp.]
MPVKINNLKDAKVTVVKRPPTLLGRFEVDFSAKAVITRHWNDLRESPGDAVSDLEKVKGGFRIRYKHGDIYYGGSGAPAWIHGAIRIRYEEIGGPNSWLGLPKADESDFSEGGRVVVFQNGEIYWWPDVGAVELNEVRVHYTGLICFEETNWDASSNSDEPYVIISTVAYNGGHTEKTRTYDDVDGGESRPDLLDVYLGKPWGLAIHCLLMEHDEGNPDKYKEVVKNAVMAASAGISTVTALVPIVGPALSGIVGPLLKLLEPDIVGGVNALLDTDDDQLGQHAIVLTGKDMVVFAAKAMESKEKDVIYKFATPNISGDGASYRVYFTMSPA